MTRVVTGELPVDEPVSDKQFELLQTIAALTGELGHPPTLSEVGDAYGCSKQHVHQAARGLMRKGMLEEPAYPHATRCLVLSRNAKLLIERELDAGLKE